MKLAVVIPALDEEASIGTVVSQLAAAARKAGDHPVVIVVDNGSRDATAERAKAAGATVVYEPHKGYGRACLTGLHAMQRLLPNVDAVLFADGDGSDDPAFVPALLLPLREKRAQLVIGSRERGVRAGLVEPGSLTVAQRFGNKLASALLVVAYGQPTTDLGPFRAIDARALERLRMDDNGFGWTVQMQARAARQRLRTVEVAVAYRRRTHGKSKVSGNVRASAQAGAIILWTLLREARR